MPKTTKKESILPAGQTKELIQNIVLEYLNSIIELGEGSKFICSDISANGGRVYADYLELNTNISDAPVTAGTIYYDEQDDCIAMKLPLSTLQVGKEQYIDGLNKTSATITNGSIVYVSGAQGNRTTVDLASNSSYANSQRTIGFSTHDIENNVNGNVTTFGLVRDLDTSAYTEGDCIYLDSTAGAYTTVTPSFGTIRQKVGIVVKSHVTQGEIFCCVKEEKYMFGDPDSGDFTGFEDDGTMVAKGGAITYRDEYVGGEYFVPQGANAPDEVNVTIAGVVTKKYAFDGVNTVEKLGNTFEINHYIATSQISAGTEELQIHAHVAPSNATSTGTAKMFVDWCLIKAQGAPLTGSQVSFTVDITASQQYHNLISGVALPTVSEDFEIGDLIEFTLTRDYSDSADTYPADLIFYKTALHVPCDMIGSRGIYTK